eukprot:gene41199-65222_t
MDRQEIGPRATRWPVTEPGRSRAASVSATSVLIGLVPGERSGDVHLRALAGAPATGSNH